MTYPQTDERLAEIMKKPMALWTPSDWSTAKLAWINEALDEVFLKP